ncbi:MAG: protoheme IX farnesyltransferase [Elusimicrobia bacterium]|nr:protoheme IX farnesyltransferase [Elusimicrobiota bacterium]
MTPYLELMKPRITSFVVFTAWLGWRFSGRPDAPELWWTLLGVGLASASSGTLNQWLESDQDARMERTSRRPLPSGRLSPDAALAFGVALGAAGLSILASRVGNLPAFLTAATLVLYVAFYTPLKRVTPHSTWFGAVSGALPPMVGWAAAKGSLGAGAWALFSIQFLWQMPHFLALFWLYREQYERAGFRVISVVDPGGRSTAFQIAVHSLGLLVATMMPLLFGVTGLGYGVGALLLGSAFLAMALRTAWTMRAEDHRLLFRASLVYLPAVFGLLAVGAP